MKYLKIEYCNSIYRKKESFIVRLLFRIIHFFIPKANPDYEDKIGDVKYWLIEFNEDNIPVREIGLNENEIIILKMPYKKKLRLLDR